MTGSGIFAAEGEVEEDESANASATPVRTVSKNYQVVLSAKHKIICVLFHCHLKVVFSHFFSVRNFINFRCYARKLRGGAYLTVSCFAHIWMAFIEVAANC